MKENIFDVAKKLIKESTSVFVTAIDEEGYPRTKAMFTVPQSEIKVHYFSTNLSSQTAGRFSANSHCCIYFCNESEGVGLSITGNIEVCQDAYHKELLWKEGDEQYYYLGVTDPDYVVYKFTGINCDMWYGGKFSFHIDELVAAINK